MKDKEVVTHFKGPGAWLSQANELEDDEPEGEISDVPEEIA